MSLRSLRNLPWFVLRNRLSLPHRGITLTLPHLQVLTVDHPVNGFMNFLRRYLRDITAGKMLQPKLNFGFVIIQRSLMFFFAQPPDAALFEGSDGQVADLVNPPRFRLQLVVELLSLLFVPRAKRSPNSFS